MIDKIKKTKTTVHFKKAIEAHIGKMIDEDPYYEDKVNAEGKSVDKCITYILNTVQKSGVQGFTDSEVFGMVNHYYDEPNIDVGKDIDMRVVVNHTVELTQEEKDKAKQDAKDKIMRDEMARLRGGKTAKYKGSNKIIVHKGKKEEKLKEGEQISMF